MPDRHHVQLQRRIQKAVSALRASYYDTHYEEPIKTNHPYGGKPTESIGAFAEYNLRGPHCPRSKAGLCSPCFYSKFPNVIGSDYPHLIIDQVDYIIDNFQTTILSQQYGKIYYDPEQMKNKGVNPIACCITPVGSFFNEGEFPKEARLYLLKRLLSISDTFSRDVILYVESHAFDFLSWRSTEEELELMRRLHLRVVFGFESSNDFVRNVLFGKNLELHDFERAVTRAKELSYGTYAFTFAGLYPMSQQETLEDARKTFQYLKSKDISPVVMFANTQEYTISDVLVKSGRFKLINPITVLEIIKDMINTFGRTRYDGFDAWLIADPVGGPPVPSQHIFSGNEISCCSEKIYHIIKELRIDHEYPLFEENYQQVSQCSIHQSLIGELFEVPEETLESRTEKMLDYIELIANNYIAQRREEELSVVKAHLLCEGVHMDSATKEALVALSISNGFIHSTNLMLDKIPVNACMMETFVDNPSCTLTYINQKFYLHFTDKSTEIPSFIGEVGFLRIPEWGKRIVAGYQISDFLRPHSPKCISIWPNQSCDLGTDRCQFCSLTGNITLSPEIVAEMVDAALANHPEYEVHLSGGVWRGVDENPAYYSKVAKLIRNRHPSTKISLETIPPLSVKGLDLYYESGINSILMNLEIANETLRHQICPGKSKIPYDKYLEMYREAVERFGKWNVGAVILFGIEDISNEEFLHCAKQLCEIGVFPVIMPFQPLQNSKLRQARATDPDAFLDISRTIAKIRNEYAKAESFCSFGCLNCGACSIDHI